MAEIHVQARKHSRVNPTWMWAWIILGIIIIAAVVYFIYANKNKNNPSNTQETKNQHNTPVSGIELPQQFTGTTYMMSTVA
jgi:YbbR domain-containing protein